MAKRVRKSISLPGLLAEAAVLRSQEFGHRQFSPLAVDLVCYDLRSGASHSITLPISLDTQATQDAVDREIVARYRPGQQRGGLLLDFVQRFDALRQCATPGTQPIPIKTKAEKVLFPALLWPLIETRWKELGYPSLSAYVVGLLRYDLLIGGPHLFSAADRKPEIRAALDRETLAARSSREKRKLFLDYLIERVQGRVLTRVELDRRKAEVAQQLLQHVRSKRF